MKRLLITLSLLLVLVGSAGAQDKRSYVIGFYNLENLFDVYDDPVKNDEEFLPDGTNKWTEAKYQKKLPGMDFGNLAGMLAGIMNAADPIAMIDEMIAATRRAADDLKKQAE